MSSKKHEFICIVRGHHSLCPDWNMDLACDCEVKEVPYDTPTAWDDHMSVINDKPVHCDGCDKTFDLGESFLDIEAADAVPQHLEVIKGEVVFSCKQGGSCANHDHD